MPKVLNKYKDYIPPDAVYIGRPSKWGNPFIVGYDGDREEVIQRYYQWIRTQPKLFSDIAYELLGKDLVCFCAPKLCHGNVLLELANPDYVVL